MLGSGYTGDKIELTGAGPLDRAPSFLNFSLHCDRNPLYDQLTYPDPRISIIFTTALESANTDSRPLYDPYCIFEIGLSATNLAQYQLSFGTKSDHEMDVTPIS